MGKGLHALPIADGFDWYNERGGDGTCFMGFHGMRMEMEQGPGSSKPVPFPSLFSLLGKVNCGPLLQSASSLLSGCSVVSSHLAQGGPCSALGDKGHL